MGNFPTPKQTPIGIWDLVSRFPSRYRHFEFLIHLLIGPIFKTTSWIWKTIESIVLETIAYCLSRLLIGYGSYKPPIVVISEPMASLLFFILFWYHKY